MAWGADTLLATTAVLAGHRVEVLGVPATELRNRPEAKAAAQLDDTLRLHQQLARVLPEVFAVGTPEQ